VILQKLAREEAERVATRIRETLRRSGTPAAFRQYWRLGYHGEGERVEKLLQEADQTCTWKSAAKGKRRAMPPILPAALEKDLSCLALAIWTAERPSIDRQSLLVATTTMSSLRA